MVKNKLKTLLKKAIEKAAVAIGDLTGYKIANKSANTRE